MADPKAKPTAPQLCLANGLRRGRDLVFPPVQPQSTERDAQGREPEDGARRLGLGSGLGYRTGELGSVIHSAWHDLFRCYPKPQVPCGSKASGLTWMVGLTWLQPYLSAMLRNGKKKKKSKEPASSQDRDVPLHSPCSPAEKEL